MKLQKTLEITLDVDIEYVMESIMDGYSDELVKHIDIGFIVATYGADILLKEIKRQENNPDPLNLEE